MNKRLLSKNVLRATDYSRLSWSQHRWIRLGWVSNVQQEHERKNRSVPVRHEFRIVAGSKPSSIIILNRENAIHKVFIYQAPLSG